MSATKVVRLGITASPAFTYYVRGHEVWRVQRRMIGDASRVVPERVASTDLVPSPKNIYFLDEDGDISFCPRP